MPLKPGWKQSCRFHFIRVRFSTTVLRLPKLGISVGSVGDYSYSILGTHWIMRRFE